MDPGLVPPLRLGTRVGLAPMEWPGPTKCLKQTLSVADSGKTPERLARSVLTSLRYRPKSMRFDTSRSRESVNLPPFLLRRSP
jgi:hypothetical protein